MPFALIVKSIESLKLIRLNWLKVKLSSNLLDESTRESIANTNEAVFPVPDWDWAIIFWGGSASRVGKAVSWILDGALKPIPEIKMEIFVITPFNKAGDTLES